MDEFNNPNVSNEQQPASSNQGTPEAADKKGMSIASMVLGIVSVVLMCIWYVSIPCAIVGLILGILSTKSSKGGMAKAGIVLSVIGIVLAIVWIAAISVLIINFMNTL